MGQPVDLNTLHAVSVPSGSILTWHTATPVSDQNFIGFSAAYPRTDTVYAAYRSVDGCYNPDLPVEVEILTPDLQVTVSPSSLTSPASTVQEFVVTVTNNGPIAAPNATVRVPLPSNRSLVLAKPSGGSYDRGTGLWQIGALNNGASVTLTLTLRIDL
jgi:uncharacterized repeat protein (TIGR01451 family)